MLGGFLSKPVTELGCFAELSFYNLLLIRHLGVPSQDQGFIVKVLYVEDKEGQAHS